MKIRKFSQMPKINEAVDAMIYYKDKERVESILIKAISELKGFNDSYKSIDFIKTDENYNDIPNMLMAMQDGLDTIQNLSHVEKEVEDDGLGENPVFLATKGVNTATVSIDDIEDASKVLQTLNNSGFDLGSGHEEIEMIKIDDDSYNFRGTTYMGAPTQNVEFTLLK